MRSSEPMDKAEIKQVLQIPDAAFVDWALDQARLYPNERRAIELRAFDGMTIFEAADKMHIGETTFKDYQRQGMEKLNRAWTGRRAIEAARREYFPQ